MKIRLGLLLTSILLVAATAAAASPAAASPPAPPAPQADGAVTPDCGLSPAAPLTSLTLASSSPAPTLLYSGATCGSCSRSPCVGATYDTVCGYENGQYGYCLSPLGNNCTDGITFKCQCWYGPLP
ncbi:MAG TPA: hypothetical protein VJA16_17895 [Thermoanaerobaculia bacterium]